MKENLMRPLTTEGITATYGGKPSTFQSLGMAQETCSEKAADTPNFRMPAKVSIASLFIQ